MGPRGAGVGRRLGEHSIARARALGFEAMQFNFVVATNTAAVRRWESLGFRTIARLPRAFEHARLGPVDALVMFRSLHDGSEDVGLAARVHAAVMRTFVERCRAATVSELSAALEAPRAGVEDALRRLHDDHGLVLHPGSTEIWIAHPFAASPTGTWVDAGDGRGWWAPCVWCALGISVLAAPNATIHARLGGEAREVRIELRGGEPASDEPFVHFALPVRVAWDNVVSRCSTVGSSSSRASGTADTSARTGARGPSTRRARSSGVSGSRGTCGPFPPATIVSDRLVRSGTI
jgi:hypothetical protein